MKKLLYLLFITNIVFGSKKNDLSLMNALPNELIYIIASFLPNNQKLKLRCISKQFFNDQIQKLILDMLILVFKNYLRYSHLSSSNYENFIQLKNVFASIRESEQLFYSLLYKEAHHRFFYDKNCLDFFVLKMSRIVLDQKIKQESTFYIDYIRKKKTTKQKNGNSSKVFFLKINDVLTEDNIIKIIDEIKKRSVSLNDKIRFILLKVNFRDQIYYFKIAELCTRLKEELAERLKIIDLTNINLNCIYNNDIAVEKFFNASCTFYVNSNHSVLFQEEFRKKYNMIGIISNKSKNLAEKQQVRLRLKPYKFCYDDKILLLKQNKNEVCQKFDDNVLDVLCKEGCVLKIIPEVLLTYQGDIFDFVNKIKQYVSPCILIKQKENFLAGLIQRLHLLANRNIISSDLTNFIKFANSYNIKINNYYINYFNIFAGKIDPFLKTNDTTILEIFFSELYQFSGAKSNYLVQKINNTKNQTINVISSIGGLLPFGLGLNNTQEAINDFLYKSKSGQLCLFQLVIQNYNDQKNKENFWQKKNN